MNTFIFIVANYIYSFSMIKGTEKIIFTSLAEDNLKFIMTTKGNIDEEERKLKYMEKVISFILKTTPIVNSVLTTLMFIFSSKKRDVLSFGAKTLGFSEEMNAAEIYAYSKDKSMSTITKINKGRYHTLSIKKNGQYGDIYYYYNEMTRRIKALTGTGYLSNLSEKELEEIVRRNLNGEINDEDYIIEACDDEEVPSQISEEKSLATIEPNIEKFKKDLEEFKEFILNNYSNSVYEQENTKQRQAARRREIGKYKVGE